jgi:hypothetical protein
VLAKNSNTDLDFVWSADASGIPATIFDAKGDLIAASAADSAARLAVGTNGQVLTADSTAATGIKWATASAAKNYSLLGSGTMSGASTVTISGISGIDEIYVLFRNLTNTTNLSSLYCLFNTDTGSNYDQTGFYIGNPSTYTGSILNADGADSQTEIEIGRKANNSSSKINGELFLSGCATTGKKIYQFSSGSDAGTDTNGRARWGSGVYNSTSTISSISLKFAGTNFDGGVFRVYGAA